MIPTDTPNRYRLEATDYLDYGTGDFIGIANYAYGNADHVTLVVPKDAVVTLTDSSGATVSPSAVVYSIIESPSPREVKEIRFDPGYEFTDDPNNPSSSLSRLRQFTEQTVSHPFCLAIHVPLSGMTGSTHHAELDQMPLLPFNTSVLSKEDSPSPRSNPNGQPVDIPLPEDDSYKHFLLNGHAVWSNGVATMGWLPANSPSRQAVAVLLNITKKMKFDQYALAIPERVQVEFMDISNPSSPSRAVLLGGTDDDSCSGVIEPASSFEEDGFPSLPDAALSLAGIEAWVPFGESLGGHCRIWNDGGSRYSESQWFVFMVHAAPFMEYLSSPSLEPAVRMRVGNGLSDEGWPSWNAWSPLVAFGLNRLPTAPSNLSMKLRN